MITFNFKQHYILENKYVRLIPLQHTDLERLLPFSINEPEIWEHSLAQAIGKNELENYIQNAIQAKDNCKEYPFIVFDKQTNAFAGCTRFYDIQLKNKCLNIGYTWYGKKFQGTGLNKQCKFLMLQFAFDTMDFERVEFKVDSINERSILAINSLGCTKEGVLRNNCVRPNGTRRDTIVYSILKTEWHTNKKVELKNKIDLLIKMATKITISTVVNAPIQMVWECYTKPEHITKWNFASDDWHCPRAENDVRVGGKNSTRMEAKDGSFGFDFNLIYDTVILHKELSYTMEDGRKAITLFQTLDNQTLVTTTFDAETENSVELQQQGWQMILNNFKKHAESIK